MVSDEQPHDADRWLDGLADFERRPPSGAGAFSLDGLVRILAALGDPHLGRRVVHVTGTKGKGTVVHACDAILAAHGVRTMRTTSPHLHTPLERITIDRHPIDAGVFRTHVLAIREAATVAGSGDPTWFEVVTIAAWLEARRRSVDVDLLEVGLGGRLDATNVCRPSVAVVTSIGLDHTAILGDTHDAIAYEKGGIIKSGRPVVIGPSPTDPGGGVLHALAAGISQEGDPFKASFAAYLARHRDDLERGRFVTFNEDGHHFINWSRTSMLMIGAVRQLGMRLEALESRLALAGGHDGAALEG